MRLGEQSAGSVERVVGPAAVAEGLVLHSPAAIIETLVGQPEWYATGVKVTDAEMDALPLTRHDWHGDWNYTLAATPNA